MTPAGEDFDLSPPPLQQLTQLAAGLGEAERRLLLAHGEEAPFCGTMFAEKRQGVYCCRLCGLPLFSAGAKFDSGTGWPSFTAPFAAGHLHELPDDRHGMIRTEVVCARCGAHQGHVFPDGPPPSRQRYCINAGSLDFVPAGEKLPDKLGRGPPEGRPWPS